jgi:hypothetical protein
MHRGIALACVWWFALCATPRTADQVLVFGMTKEYVASMFGERMRYWSGRPGAEVYVIEQTAPIPGFPADERVWLQFRRDWTTGRDHLTGWKSDWQMREPLF